MDTNALSITIRAAVGGIEKLFPPGSILQPLYRDQKEGGHGAVLLRPLQVPGCRDRDRFYRFYQAGGKRQPQDTFPHEGTVKAITDRLYPKIVDWQGRPPGSLYPVVWLDAMHFKVREDGVGKTKAVYSIQPMT